MDNPKVSVIVSMYNAETFLPASLESLARQTFGDFEVLCVDDGSSDASVGVAQAFSERDRRFRVLRHLSNRGPGGAFNTGLDSAAGHYIAAVDSDDVAAPHMLETLVGASSHGTADVVLGGYREVLPSGESNGRIHLPSDDFPNSRDRTPQILRVSTQLFARLWRRTLFTDHDIRCPEGVYHNDMATAPRVLFFARSICMTDVPVYDYRVRDASVSHRFNDRRASSYETGFRIVRDFLRTHEVFEDMESDFFGWVSGHLGHGLGGSDLLASGDDRFTDGLASLMAVKAAFLPGGGPPVATISREDAPYHLEDYVSHVGSAAFPGWVLASARGTRQGPCRVGSVREDGRGTLTFGPYLTLTRGRYRATIHYGAKGWGHRWDLVAQSGSSVLAGGALAQRSRSTSVEFDLLDHTRGVEIRTHLGRIGTLALEKIQLERLQASEASHSSRSRS